MKGFSDLTVYGLGAAGIVVFLWMLSQGWFQSGLAQIGIMAFIAATLYIGAVKSNSKQRVTYLGMAALAVVVLMVGPQVGLFTFTGTDYYYFETTELCECVGKANPEMLGKTCDLGFKSPSTPTQGAYMCNDFCNNAPSTRLSSTDIQTCLSQSACNSYWVCGTCVNDMYPWGCSDSSDGQDWYQVDCHGGVQASRPARIWNSKVCGEGYKLTCEGLSPTGDGWTCKLLNPSNPPSTCAKTGESCASVACCTSSDVCVESFMSETCMATNPPSTCANCVEKEGMILKCDSTNNYACDYAKAPTGEPEDWSMYVAGGVLVLLGLMVALLGRR